MDPDDGTYDSPLEPLEDVVEEVFHAPEPPDPEEPRDPMWLRWLKFASIIFIMAVLFGGLAWCTNYYREYNHVRYNRTDALRETGDQVISSMKTWFWTGAGIGGGIGLIYVVRCIIKKADP